jgi:transposase-like protein
MKCLYCAHPYTYRLSDNQRKCSKCKRKFSPRKKERKEKLWKKFLEGNTVAETTKRLGMHPVTVQKYFDQFRRYVAALSDKNYQHNAHLVTDYDEYLYLPKSLKIETDLDKLQHFITLSYNHRVYNLMMPTVSHYSSPDTTAQEQKLILKYLTYNKVAKMSEARSTITRFWEYFEQFILKYKGVTQEQFIYYLKEAEWRFNEGVNQ